jgi:hypothetical protein
VREGDPDFWGWVRACFWDNGIEDDYAGQVLGLSGDKSGTPDPVHALGGLPHPTTTQWADLLDVFHVPNHFHLIKPGDQYIILQYTFHYFLNALGLPTCSLTCDGLLSGSQHPLAKYEIPSSEV